MMKNTITVSSTAVAAPIATAAMTPATATLKGFIMNRN